MLNGNKSWQQGNFYVHLYNHIDWTKVWDTIKNEFTNSQNKS